MGLEALKRQQSVWRFETKGLGGYTVMSVTLKGFTSTAAVQMFLHPYGRRMIAFAGGIMLLFLLSAIAVAEEAQPKPSGTVTIHQVQVSFIGSGAGGGGTLHFQGRNYPFKLGGLGIGGIGVTSIDATGTVYNLTRVEDFEGTYGETRTGWAVGSEGKGQMWMKNPNGVYIHLMAQRKGLSLNLGASGMVVHLGS